MYVLHMLILRFIDNLTVDNFGMYGYNETHQKHTGHRSPDEHYFTCSSGLFCIPGYAFDHRQKKIGAAC